MQAHNFIHGHSMNAKVGKPASSEYRSWTSMKTRCLNEKSVSFVRYGALGVTVCDRWMTFENFLLDMGPRPSGSSLDRIDGSKGYEPGNCRWATASQQSINRKYKRNKSRIQCVYWIEKTEQWHIAMQRNGKLIINTNSKSLFEACCLVKSFLAKENSAQEMK